VRKICLLTVILLLSLTQAASAVEEEKVCSRIGATDQEAQEGYFAFGNETMLVVKPNSKMHNYLRGQVGQRRCLTIGADLEPTE
jgi:hypothetical protein